MWPEKPRTLEIPNGCLLWPITAKIRTCKLATKPQTCGSVFSCLIGLLLATLTITFQKYLRCSRFSRFDCNNAQMPSFYIYSAYYKKSGYHKLVLIITILSSETNVFLDYFNPRSYNKTTETSQPWERVVILHRNIVCDLSNVKRMTVYRVAQNFCEF